MNNNENVNVIKNNLINFIFAQLKIVSIGFVGFILIYSGFSMYKNYDIEKNLPLAPFVDDGICNVPVVQLSGTIGVGATSAITNESGTPYYTIPATGDVDRVIHDLEYIKNYSNKKGVILQVDSYGGVGNAAQVLSAYLKTYPLPVVALIRDAGTSMGYWVTLDTKRVIAYPGAMVGSIGIDSSFISNVEKNKRDGVEYISIVSGKRKDLGSPDRPISEEEKKYLLEENDKFFQMFKNHVKEKRNISDEKISSLSDGSVWMAEEAKELGLIDEVGDVTSALSWLEKYWQENSSLSADLLSGSVNQEKAYVCPMY